MQPLERHFAEKILLRERRALIRRVRLVADELDRAVEPVLTQGFDERLAGLSGADDDNGADLR